MVDTCVWLSAGVTHGSDREIGENRRVSRKRHTERDESFTQCCPPFSIWLSYLLFSVTLRLEIDSTLHDLVPLLIVCFIEIFVNKLLCISKQPFFRFLTSPHQALRWAFTLPLNSQLPTVRINQQFPMVWVTLHLRSSHLLLNEQCVKTAPSWWRF